MVVKEVISKINGNARIIWVVVFLFILSLIFQFLLSIGGIISNSEFYFGYSTFKKQTIFIETLDISSRRGAAYNNTLNVRGFTKDSKEVSFFPFQLREQSFLVNYFGSNSLGDFKGNVTVFKSNEYSKIYFYEKYLDPLTFYNLWKPRIFDISCTVLLYILIKIMILYDNRLLRKYGLNTKLYNKLKEEGKLEEYLKKYIK